MVFKLVIAASLPSHLRPSSQRGGSIDRAFAKHQLRKSAFGGTQGLEAMTKPELGTKRLCADCGAKFYDLNHAPITCPKCGGFFEAVQVSSRLRAQAARAPVREVEPVVAETPEDQFVPLEDADAEAQGEKKPGGAPEAEDEVEADDESLDDAAFIEEREDTEVTGDIEIEIEKGT
jgi:uncharacterized protein (TIGR02300 family)